MLRHSTFFIAGILITGPLPAAESDHPQKELTAYPLIGAIRIDGHLDEAIWESPAVTTFTQRNPQEGEPATQRTEVVVAYDKNAIYIGARLFDTAPDSIIHRLARRDDDVSADQFTIGIDAWLDHRTGFYFGITAGGSIRDGTLFNDIGTDGSWDGVWESAVQITDEGWFVEVRIPFSQLRYPDRPVHTWGINFRRQIERNREDAWYVAVPKASTGMVSWFAHLNGIEDISSPSRIELLPYSVGKNALTHPDDGDPFTDGSDFSGQLGLDFKLRLTSSLTLDGTINPDFGQVEVDPAVVNLSDFETFFPERRPFFIEGRDIFRFGRGGTNNNWSFNWGDPNHFYSRRIGRQPQLAPVRLYDYLSTPDGTSILGAAKLTGKLTEQWSIGVMSAVTGREFAQADSAGDRFTEEVEPLSSYNVIRAKREFDEGRHGLGILSAFMARDLRSDRLEGALSRTSLDSGVDGWITLDKDNTYVLAGWIATSTVRGNSDVITALQTSSTHYFQRPGIDYLSVDSSATRLSGLSGRLYINKQKGNVVFNSALGTVSPGYEVNDMGFQSNSDRINWHLALGYRTYQPGRYFRDTFVALATFRNWDYGGNLFGEGYFLFTDATFLNYWSGSFNLFYNPEVINKNLTRGGVLTLQPPQNFFSLNFNSDRRKNLSFNAGVFQGRATRVFRSANVGINYKPNATVQINLSPEYSVDITEASWIGQIEDATATATAGTRYLYAESVQKSFTLRTRLNWTFTPKLSLQLYAQPLIFAIDYKDYKELAASNSFRFNIYGQDAGSTITSATDSFGDISHTIDPDGTGAAPSFTIDDADFNFKSLRGNVVLRWEYRPGSVFYFAWTQTRSNFESIGVFDLAANSRTLLREKSDNIFLIKFTYWLTP
ncbi:MAG: carbohydrate binding family 9 domain-containing protein [Candidatus Marinimicrobia bacterium]|nr:carbohydrate binding family 9 domain-containing protein [Candidatus Neomarinimicrobiota bacterium]